MNDALRNSKTVPLLIVQAAIAISTAVTAITGVMYGASSGQNGDDLIGLGYFKAFTMDSNVLAGICALLIVCYLIRILVKKEGALPKWLVCFQLVTATCLLLTFVTVVCFLGPSNILEGKPYLEMFSNDLLVFHLTNPLLAIVSFVFLCEGYEFERRDRLWSLIPVAAYIIVYALMVLVFGRWLDFYGFAFDGNYFLTLVAIAVMLLATYLFGWLLIWMNSKALRCNA